MSAVLKGRSGAAEPAWHHPRQSPAVLTVRMCGFAPASPTASVVLRLPSPSKSFISLTSISVLPYMGTIPFVSSLYLSGTMCVGLRGCPCLSDEKVWPNYSKEDENWSKRKKLGGVWSGDAKNNISCTLLEFILRKVHFKLVEAKT